MPYGTTSGPEGVVNANANAHLLPRVVHQTQRRNGDEGCSENVFLPTLFLFVVVLTTTLAVAMMRTTASLPCRSNHHAPIVFAEAFLVMPSWTATTTTTTTTFRTSRRRYGHHLGHNMGLYKSPLFPLQVLHASSSTTQRDPPILMTKFDVLWEEHYHELVQYAKDNMGSTNPPRGTTLGNWASKQRCYYNKKWLSDQRMEKLNKIGFEWSIPRQYSPVPWEETYGRLVRFKQDNGHTNVPHHYLQDPKLGHWVDNQRQQYKFKKLKLERIEMLEEIGFNWSYMTVQERWQKGYQNLYNFWMKHNHTLVPPRFDDNPELGSWVRLQRMNYRSGILSEDQIYQLSQIGFVWDPLEAAWMEMYQKLVAYSEEHGDAAVPRQYPADPSLGRWVSTQRNALKNGKLEGARVAMLDQIGFVWDPLEAAWMDMYQKLVAYSEEHGDAAVPKRYPKNPSLGGWVQTQRNALKNGKLEGTRVAMLDQIGFVWDTKNHLLRLAGNSSSDGTNKSIATQ